MAVRQDSYYTGSAVFLYDAKTNGLMARSTVIGHNKGDMSVEIDELLPFRSGTAVTVLILTSPVPRSYQGRLIVRGSKTSVALHHGKEKEGRKSPRHPVNLPATIVQRVYSQRGDGNPDPIPVSIVNISTTGIRIRTPLETLSAGDIFQIRLMIGNKAQVMTAEAVFAQDNRTDSEYGCQFLAGKPDDEEG